MKPKKKDVCRIVSHANSRSDYGEDMDELEVREWGDGPSRKARRSKCYPLVDLKGKVIKSAVLGRDQEGDSTLWIAFTDGTTFITTEDMLMHGTALPALTASLLLQGKDTTIR